MGLDGIGDGAGFWKRRPHASNDWSRGRGISLSDPGREQRIPLAGGSGDCGAKAVAVGRDGALV